MIKISVIIPTYNSEGTILNAVMSVVNQTKKPSEVIISDNGSTDNTVKIVKKIQAENLGLKICLTNCKGVGSGLNRNHGVSESSGHVFAFLDSDDHWDVDFLEQLTAVPIPINTIRGAYARYTTHSGVILGTSIRSKNDLDARNRMLERGNMPFLLSSWVMNRSTFLELDGFDPEFFLSEDFDFMFRHLRNGGEIQVIRKELLSYLIHPTSETTQTHFMQRLAAKYVLERYQYPQKSLKQFIEDNLENKTLRRQSRSDIIIRDFVIRQKSAGLSRIDLLGLAFLLSPLRFMRKLVDQRPTKISLFK